MGKRGSEQEDLFVTHQQMRGPGHPFYKAVNEVLAAHGFDSFVEARCKKFYSDKVGRPSIPPGNSLASAASSAGRISSMVALAVATSIVNSLMTGQGITKLAACISQRFVG